MNQPAGDDEEFISYKVARHKRLDAQGVPENRRTRAIPGEITKHLDEDIDQGRRFWHTSVWSKEEMDMWTVQKEEFLDPLDPNLKQSDITPDNGSGQPFDSQRGRLFVLTQAERLAAEAEQAKAKAKAKGQGRLFGQPVGPPSKPAVKPIPKPENTPTKPKPPEPEVYKAFPTKPKQPDPKPKPPEPKQDEQEEAEFQDLPPPPPPEKPAPPEKPGSGKLPADKPDPQKGNKQPTQSDMPASSGDGQEMSDKATEIDREIALLRIREFGLKKELAEASSGASEPKGWGHAYKVESYMLNLMFLNCLELSPAMNLNE